MKKILLICAAATLAVSAFATGSVGVNPPQSGVITVTNGAQSVTNTFAYPFQTTPVLVVYCNATNGTPVTNNFVTTTNFAISFPVAGTNDAYSWQAYVGGTRMQSGSVISGGGTNVTVTFANAYAVAPVVVVTGNSTNAANTIGIPAITTTNFTILSNGNSTNQWISVGTVYNPPSDYTGQNPRNNTVIY